MENIFCLEKYITLSNKIIKHLHTKKHFMEIMVFQCNKVSSSRNTIVKNSGSQHLEIGDSLFRAIENKCPHMEF